MGAGSPVTPVTPVAARSAGDTPATPATPVRDAGPDDGPALVALAEACPMRGDVGLCVDRAPDFFALNRLEGDRWRVGVVDGADGAAVGCVAVAEREAWLNGVARTVLYVGDLKVHPAHRGGGAADALEEWVRAACEQWGGPEALVHLTILAGNRAMERAVVRSNKRCA